MSATAKSVIIAAFGLLFAVILGSEVGQSSWMIPIVTAAVCVGMFIYVALFRTVRLEALILAFLIFGYIVGNRGFAQLTFQQNSFLYAGEVGMLACLLLVGARRTLTREPLIPKTPLAWAILAFLLLGGLRLYFDTVLLNTNSLLTTAIRDSATVYYALFFFIAYQIGKNASARKFLERTMLVSFIFLIPVAVLVIWAPDVLTSLTFRGYPLIYYKNDLLTTFLGIGAFCFFLTPGNSVAKFFLRSCSLACLTLMLLGMSRAALSGFGCAVLLLLVARRFKFIAYQIGVAAVVLFAIAFLKLSNIHFESDFFRHLSDKITSVVDFSATGHYRSETGDISAANNEFRTVWWTTVINDTLDKNAWFGLGFGYDLSASFLRTYYANQQAQWDVRSPHSISITIFGRLGVVGALLFTIIMFLILRSAIRAAREVARGRADSQSLINWCAVVTLLCTALFGVVLEGPMGGILFWTFLGLAVSQQSPEGERETVREGVREQPERVLAEASAGSRRVVNL